MKLVKKFYRTPEEFEKIHHSLKQTQCPNCQMEGFLILHGFLRGYDEEGLSKVKVRGRRLYCSNRYNRNGCGGTFSLVVTTILKRFHISGRSLWKYLDGIAQGMSKIEAFRRVGLHMSNTTVYRLYKTLQRCQTEIRTLLLKRCASPPLSHETSPVIQTILHLKTAFTEKLCPVEAFQEHFQRPFL